MPCRLARGRESSRPSSPLSLVTCGLHQPRDGLTLTCYVLSFLSSSTFWRRWTTASSRAKLVRCVFKASSVCSHPSNTPALCCSRTRLNSSSCSGMLLKITSSVSWTYNVTKYLYLLIHYLTCQYCVVVVCPCLILWLGLVCPRSC